MLTDLVEGITHALGARLAGVYLYGSLATGGFEPGLSDADLLAATNGDIDANDLERLRGIHAQIVRRHPAWNDRIEVVYFSVGGLRAFKTTRSPIAVISPGEPLHFRGEGAGADWLMNWHLVLNGGVTLFGPDPAGFIEPTSTAEFIESLRQHVLSGDEWVSHARDQKAQSYVIFTMCRTLVALRTGRHSSKREAAEWVSVQFPQWEPLIRRALAWRTDPDAARREDL